jgi:hypothetical protein
MKLTFSIIAACVLIPVVAVGVFHAYAQHGDYDHE